MCVFVTTQYLCSWIFPPLLSFWFWSVLSLLLPNILTLKKKKNVYPAIQHPFHMQYVQGLSFHFIIVLELFMCEYFINHIFFKNQYLKAHTHKSLSSFTSISPSPTVFVLFAWICTELFLDYLLITWVFLFWFESS